MLQLNERSSQSEENIEVYWQKASIQLEQLLEKAHQSKIKQAFQTVISYLEKLIKQLRGHLSNTHYLLYQLHLLNGRLHMVLFEMDSSEESDAKQYLNVAIEEFKSILPSVDLILPSFWATKIEIYSQYLDCLKRTNSLNKTNDLEKQILMIHLKLDIMLKVMK